MGSQPVVGRRDPNTGTALSSGTEVERAQWGADICEKVGCRDGYGPSLHGQEFGLYPFSGGGPVVPSERVLECPI